MQIEALLKGPFEVVNGDYGNGVLAKMLWLKLKGYGMVPGQLGEKKKYIQTKTLRSK